MKTIPVSFKRFPALFQTYRSSLFLCSFSDSSAKRKITIKVNFQSVFSLFANIHQSAEKENSPQKMLHSLSRLLSNVSTVCSEKRQQLRVEFTSCRLWRRRQEPPVNESDCDSSMKEKTKRHFQLRFVVVAVTKMLLTGNSFYLPSRGRPGGETLRRFITVKNEFLFMCGILFQPRRGGGGGGGGVDEEFVLQTVKRENECSSFVGVLLTMKMRRGGWRCVCCLIRIPPPQRSDRLSCESVCFQDTRNIFSCSSAKKTRFFCFKFGGLSLGASVWNPIFDVELF